MNNYKRIEIYVGWTCNQKCTYCAEYSVMDEAWNKRISKLDILKLLIKYRKIGYNHVTFLGGEPFIQIVFLDALKIAKKLGYTTLVTTNATTLHIDSHAKKYLPYIDELIISIQAIKAQDQQKISRTNNFVQWDLVFDNIKKYWKGNFLKANIVITHDNLNLLLNLVNYLNKKLIKNLAISYPDIIYEYYGKDFILKRIAPKYTKCFIDIPKIINICNINHINLKIVDFPFCIFPLENIEKYIELTDDNNYGSRLKLDFNDNELFHESMKKNNINNPKNKSINSISKLPRKRRHCNKCKKCFYKNICWGPSIYYGKLYGFKEINPILG